MSNRVTIILPCYNSGEHLAKAIESIRDNTSYVDWRLFLIASESTDNTNKICDTFAKENDNIFVFHTKKEGITKAINFGITKAGEDDVYLTQDDVILPNLYKKDWLTILNDLSKNQNCGAVTTIQAGGISGSSYLKGFKWVGTWSLYIPRKTINKIGLFDEDFSPGPGDDIDYSYRIMKAILDIYVADFWVDHHRMTENFNDSGDFVARNAALFRRKHGFEDINWTQSHTYNQSKALEYECVLPLPSIKGLKVLDYGCGGGRDVQKLMEKGAIVDFCDLSRENVKCTEKLTQRKDGIILDVSEKIPVLDNTYDIINCNGVLHHIPNAEDVIKEFNRILKPGGKLFVMLYTEELFYKNIDKVINISKNTNKTWQQAFGKITDECPYSTFYTMKKTANKFGRSFKLSQVKSFFNDYFKIFELYKE